MLYQDIELHLKAIIPFIHPKGSASGIEGLKFFQKRIRREMLGNLIGHFTNLARLEPEAFAHDLQQILDARNQLVHHLMERPEFRALTEESCQAAIGYLDTQFRAGRIFHDVLQAIATALIDGLKEWARPTPEETAHDCQQTRADDADGKSGMGVP